MYDDSNALIYLGGGLGFKSFSGFVGKFTVYRNRLVHLDEVLTFNLNQ